VAVHDHLPAAGAIQPGDLPQPVRAHRSPRRGALDPWYCPGARRARVPGGRMKRIIFLIAFIATAVN
jgi:hypothetical protein